MSTNKTRNSNIAKVYKAIASVDHAYTPSFSKYNYKIICSVVNTRGKACQKRKFGSLDTCLYHSKDDHILCGELNENNTKCRQRKNKCRFHVTEPVAKLKSFQCNTTNVDGSQCQNLT